MVTFTEHPPGQPCWVDLMSTDVDGAKAFYTAVFGWDAEDVDDGQGNRVYVSFSKGGKAVAGLGGQPPGMPPGMPPVWNTYVATDDPAAVSARVIEAGGQVMMPPMKVMTAGEMAVFVDPTGAAFSVWKAGDHHGAELGNEPDTWSWNELMTRDVEAAKGFYTEVFGWAYDGMDMGPMGTYHVIKGGEQGWGGLMAMPPDVPEMVPNHWMVYFLVADVEATLAKVRGAGGQVVQEPFAVPGVGTICVLHDPQGGSFSVMRPEAMG